MSTDRRTELLAWFTEQMRAKMELRRDRGDNWRDEGIDQGWLNLDDEYVELSEAVAKGDAAAIVEESVDVAIRAMYLADTSRQQEGADGER